MKESPPGRDKPQPLTGDGGLWSKAREAYPGYLRDKGNVLEGRGWLVKSENQLKNQAYQFEASKEHEINWQASSLE